MLSENMIVANCCSVDIQLMNLLSSQATCVSIILIMLVFLTAAKRSGVKPLTTHVGASPFVYKNKMFSTIAPPLIPSSKVPILCYTLTQC